MNAVVPAISVLAASFALSWIIVGLRRVGFGIDHGTPHLRKLHDAPIPRTGGVALLAAALAGALASLLRDGIHAGLTAGLLACALPCFAGGLADDLRAGVPPRVRIALTAVSALLAWWLLDVRIPRIDFAPLDRLLDHAPLNAALTVLALTTVTNGVNLVDGLNGLASVACAAIFAALAWVGSSTGDPVVTQGASWMLCAVVGFFAWNFPRGRLFLGDGGAYLLGFVAGTLSVLVVARSPSISAWFAPLLLAYPLTEVAFSVWRRRARRGRAVAAADAAHLHHLVYRRVVRLREGSTPGALRERRNALASACLWPLCAAPALSAVLLREHGTALIAALAAYVVAYVWIYTRIARLRVPSRCVLRIGDR